MREGLGRRKGSLALLRFQGLALLTASSKLVRAPDAHLPTPPDLPDLSPATERQQTCQRLAPILHRSFIEASSLDSNRLLVHDVDSFQATYLHLQHTSLLFNDATVGTSRRTFASSACS
jgi:hypothetical protein